jgi:Uncharacterised protein family (UPF0236)
MLTATAPLEDCEKKTYDNPDSLKEKLSPLFDHFVDLIEILAEEKGNMGSLEEQIAQQVLEMQRLALEQATQVKADGTDHSRCPKCNEKLKRISHGHTRHVRTRFGTIKFSRAKGYCPRCEEWYFPADDILGIDKHATASPGIQKAEALLASKMPAEEAARVMEQITGLPTDDSTLAREAKRQGDRAKKLRDKMNEEACDTKGRWRVNKQVRKDIGTKPFTLVIEVDAFCIRERDDWGKTEELLKKGEKPKRWHWVYAATVFRLDQRGQTQSGRPFILSRKYIATREGTESLSKQLYAEAVREGLLIADNVLVIADGGVWIWKIAEDRFPRAAKRLDFYHAAQHLHAVANEIYGSGTKEAKQWVEPLLHQLRHGGEAGVIDTLSELIEEVEETHREVVEREFNYFDSHKDHLDYKAGADRGEPIGSGAMESTCRQLQCRFKRPGQFWSTDGDEALLTLKCFWKNDRWDELFSMN